MLAHPALSHSLNILFIIFEKWTHGVWEGSAGIKYSVSFYGEEEEEDCSNCGLFYPWAVYSESPPNFISQFECTIYYLKKMNARRAILRSLVKIFKKFQKIFFTFLLIIVYFFLPFFNFFK